MNYISFKNLVFGFLGAGLLACSSCTQNDNVVSEEYVKEMDYLPVAIGTRSDDDGRSPLFDASILEDGFMHTDDFQSILYISQLARGLTPFLDFETIDNNDSDGGAIEPDDPDDSGVTGDSNDSDTDDTDNAKRNLYIYKYDEREKYQDPDWDDGFNFFPEQREDMLDWDNIREIGPYGNGFTLFGMYFPQSEKPLYKIVENSSGANEIHFSVKEDQSDLKNLQVSNIMAAYHTTSSLYTRLRFRLFHTMVYLRVNVYIPVFKSGTDSQGNPTVSGYPADALKSAKLLGVYPEYTFNWSADRSSDVEGPLVQLITDDTQEKIDIPMYQHPFNTDDNLPPVIEIPTSSFDPVVSDPDATDEVWVYSFSVIFPEQSDNFGNDNFLRFVLRNNLGLEKNYVFNGGQSVGAGSIGMKQGTMQQLNLYLPRDAGEAVLINADVLKWTPTVSDMHVSEDKNYED